MAKKLEEYEKKRDFDKTAEPKGETKPSGGALRFVVQRHDASRLHYDFRLEYDGVLLSWAVPKGPSLNPKDKRLAVMVEDHPIDYRNFEGTIPDDEYGGGTVQLFDEGVWIPKGDPGQSLKDGSLKFSLEGERLRGRWALIRMKPKKGEEDKNWLLIKEKDEFVRDEDGVSLIATSVRTGRTLEEIAKEAPAEDKAAGQPDEKKKQAQAEPSAEPLRSADNGSDQKAALPTGQMAEDDDGLSGEFVIGGYSVTKKSRTGLSALLLGSLQQGRLIYKGRAGKGFTQEQANELLRLFKQRERRTAPFSEVPDERGHESVIWLRPDLSARIRYQKTTARGLLSQASYLGMMKDETSEKTDPGGPRSRSEKTAKAEQKSPSEQPLGDGSGKELNYGGQKLTSPDKALFPDDAVTKKDVADYYWKLRHLILPHLVGRPLTFIRCTDQIGADCFFQKHENQPIPGVDSRTLPSSSKQEGRIMAISTEEGLMGAVQMGVLEFHSWGSSINQPDQPDWLVFDLDPDEAMAMDDIRQGVRDLKSILDELELEAFLKTSGGKGYHIVIPLAPSSDWAQARDFAKGLAQRLEQTWPKRYTANMRKDQRSGRIYVDWVRNGRGATSVSTFSLRARPGAPLSWPLRWEDLDEISPSQITLKNQAEYQDTLEGWKDFFNIKQHLKPIEWD